MNIKDVRVGTVKVVKAVIAVPEKDTPLFGTRIKELLANLSKRPGK